MQFRIQAKVCPLVITDEPIMFKGERRDALADWDDKRILMGSHVPPTERLGTLLHEVWHCWRFQCPGATEIEAECELFSMVAEAVIEDIEDQGGVRALLRLGVGDAVAAPEGDAAGAAEPFPTDQLGMLRRMRFPEIQTDEQWEFVLAVCRRFGIDPADAWAKMEPNETTNELEPRVILTQDNYAEIAGRTGKLVDIGLPEYLLPDGTWTRYWTLRDPPMVARAYVTRSDVPNPIEGVAYLEQSMRVVVNKVTGEERLARGWRDGAEAPQLGKCARNAAVKNAFRLELKGLGDRNNDDPRGEPRRLPPPVQNGEPRRAAARSPRRAGHGRTPTLASMAVDMLEQPDDPAWAARFINDRDTGQPARAAVGAGEPAGLRHGRRGVAARPEGGAVQADDGVELPGVRGGGAENGTALSDRRSAGLVGHAKAGNTHHGGPDPPRVRQVARDRYRGPALGRRAVARTATARSRTSRPSRPPPRWVKMSTMSDAQEDYRLASQINEAYINARMNAIYYGRRLDQLRRVVRVVDVAIAIGLSTSIGGLAVLHAGAGHMLLDIAVAVSALLGVAKPILNPQAAADRAGKLWTTYSNVYESMKAMQAEIQLRDGVTPDDARRLREVQATVRGLEADEEPRPRSDWWEAALDNAERELPTERLWWPAGSDFSKLKPFKASAAAGVPVAG